MLYPIKIKVMILLNLNHKIFLYVMLLFFLCNKKINNIDQYYIFMV